MGAVSPVAGGALHGLRAILRGMSRRRKRQLAVALLLMLTGGLAEMISIGAVLPFLAMLVDSSAAREVPAVQSILGLFGWQDEEDLLRPAVMLLIGAAVFAGATRLLLTWYSQKFVVMLGHDMGAQIFSRMLRQPYSFHVQRNTSEVVSGVEKVHIVIFAALLPIMQGGVAAIVSLFIVAVLIVINPIIALGAAVVMGTLYLGISFAARGLLGHNSRILAANQTARTQLVQEGLGGIRDILIDQSQPVFEESFRKLDRAFCEAKVANLFVSAAPRFVVESLGIVLLALLAVYMSGQPGGLLAAIPVIGALALGAQRMLPLLQQVYVGWSQLTGSSQILLDVVDLLEAPVGNASLRNRAVHPRPFHQTIALRGVAYAYPGSDTLALRDIDLVIGKGERIGFIGKTGSGKSTLIDLIMGLLEPRFGTICIDGVPVDDRTRADWQGQIAHVPQFIFLADASVAANIAFGEPPEQVDMMRVRAAARSARLDSVIADLPNGYETPIGERGVRLSGGQRQRLGLARALYKDASVLVLDEATSALDDQTEAEVIRALSGADRKRTILMIAHRLSTLAGCDRIVRIDSGRICEIGTFEEVVAEVVPPQLNAQSAR